MARIYRRDQGEVAIDGLGRRFAVGQRVVVFAVRAERDAFDLSIPGQTHLGRFISHQAPRLRRMITRRTTIPEKRRMFAVFNGFYSAPENAVEVAFIAQDGGSSKAE